VFAVAGLDPNFGVGGVATTDIVAGQPGSTSPTAYDDHFGDVLRQPDGKIVVAGKGASTGSISLCCVICPMGRPIPTLAQTARC
jgi:hypothetical protein